MFNIDFREGNIRFIEKEINENTELTKLSYLLREDLLFIEYGKLSLDIGWYSSEDSNIFSENILEEGLFRVYIIKKDNWEHPFFNKTCKSLSDLKLLIYEALEIINKAFSELEEENNKNNG